MVSHWNLSREPGWEERDRLLEEAFKATWTTKCSVAIDGPCQQPIVQGHIIPEARLKVISRNLQVIVAEPKPADNSTTDDPTSFDIFRPVPTSVATTDYFSCQTHEETFQIIEQEEINWLARDDRLMGRLALCAYKAILPLYVKQDRNARMLEHYATIADPARPELMAEDVATTANDQRYKASQTGQIKGLLEEMIRRKTFQHMTHIIIHTGPQPLVAANISVNISPYGQNPQFITAYPSKYGQTLILSWITLDRPCLILMGPDPEEAPERHKQAQAVSELILQASEVIAISPDVWENYGEAKQKAIREYFLRTVPYSASPVVQAYQLPHPQLLNLFNTTPLVT